MGVMEMKNSTAVAAHALARTVRSLNTRQTFPLLRTCKPRMPDEVLDDPTSCYPGAGGDRHVGPALGGLDIWGDSRERRGPETLVLLWTQASGRNLRAGSRANTGGLACSTGG